jgi:hypothetical protein
MYAWINALFKALFALFSRKGLSTPLVKPLTSSLTSSLNSKTESEILSARASLIAKYPLFNSLVDVVGGLTGVLTRASDNHIFPDYAGLWQSVTANDDPAFTGIAILSQGAITNKCKNFNVAPDAGLTGIIDDAGVVTTRVLISSLPEPYKTQVESQIQRLTDEGTNNGYIFKTVNSSGSTLDVEVDGTCGNTNKHSVSSFCVSTLGLGTLRLKNQGPSVAIPTAFARVCSEDITPTVTSRRLQFRIVDTEVIYWLGAQLEESVSASASVVITEGVVTTQAITNLSLPTTNWTGNGFSLLVCVRSLIDLAADQTLGESTNLIFYFDDSTNEFVAAVGAFESRVSFGSISGSCGLIQVDESNNMTLLIGSAVGNTVALGAPVTWGATWQVSNNLALTLESPGFYYDHKMFGSSDISVQAAIGA